MPRTSATMAKAEVSYVRTALAHSCPRFTEGRNDHLVRTLTECECFCEAEEASLAGRTAFPGFQVNGCGAPAGDRVRDSEQRSSTVYQRDAKVSIVLWGEC